MLFFCMRKSATSTLSATRTFQNILLFAVLLNIQLIKSSALILREISIIIGIKTLHYFFQNKQLYTKKDTFFFINISSNDFGLQLHKYSISNIFIFSICFYFTFIMSKYNGKNRIEVSLLYHNAAWIGTNL